MQRVPLFSATFDEGRLFDLWMLVHCLSGVAGGFSNVWFGLSTAAVYAIGIALMITWEGIEFATGIRESWENRMLDIAVGVLGIGLALAISARLDTAGQRRAFVASAALLALGLFRGWRAYRRRTSQGAEPA